MTNDQMKANRFARWAKARKTVNWIKSQIAEGKKVGIATATRVTYYDKRHAEMFKATKTGAYVQAGKKWNCIDFVSDIRAFS